MFRFVTLSEAGIIKRKVKIILEKPKPFCDVDELSAEKVSINEVAGATIFLLLFNIFTGLLLFVERMIYNMQIRAQVKK